MGTLFPDSPPAHRSELTYTTVLENARHVRAGFSGALLRSRARSVEVGCQFAVTNPQPLVYRVLEITGVLEALAVQP